MWRESLPIEQLSPWMQLNDVKLAGVRLSHGENGSAVIAEKHLTDHELCLMTVPQELVLSLENVWLYARSDRHLLEVLEATEDFSRVLSYQTRAIWPPLG